MENKIQRSSSTTSCISSLSDGLLIEILCRLDSSKTATQCKCISKRWFSLIDTNSRDSYFLRCWRKIHGQEDNIALLTQYREKLGCNELENLHVLVNPSSFSNNLPMFKPLHFLPCSASNANVSKTLVNPIHILAVFKDLVLCSPNWYDHSVYYICNPFTEQWMTLPPPPPFPHKYSWGSQIQVGVIVSENGHDFKVVRVVPICCISLPHEQRTRKSTVEVFSSDAGEWKEMFLPEVFNYEFRPAFYNGMLVWYSKSEAQILGFKFDPNSDIANSTYARFSLPQDVVEGLDEVDRHQIGVCKGCLRIAKLVPIVPIYGMKLIVWELNGHSQCWRLVNEMDLSEIDASIDRLCGRNDDNDEDFQIAAWVLTFDPQDEDILYLLFSRMGEDRECYIFSCNLRKKTLEKIHELPDLECDVFPLVMPSWPTPLPLQYSSSLNFPIL